MLLRIVLSFVLVGSWYSQGCCGSEPCPSTEPVIHVCNDNVVNGILKVYVSTGNAPIQQAVNCTCTITPSDSSENYTLVVETPGGHEDSIKFMFKVDDVTVIENTLPSFSTMVNLTGETSLTYSSPDDNTVNVCIYIAAVTDQDMFSMQCMKYEIHVHNDTTTIPTAPTLHTESNQVTQTSKNDNVSTEPTTSSSNHDTDGTSTTESSDTITEAQTQPNPSEDNTIMIAAIAGGGGVVLIILVVIWIVCCKRKKKASPYEVPKPASSSDDYSEGDYGLQLNPSYEPFNAVLPNQTPRNTDTDGANLQTAETSTPAPLYATPLKRKSSQDTANGKTTTNPNNKNEKKDAKRQYVNTDSLASHYDNSASHYKNPASHYDNPASHYDNPVSHYDHPRHNAAHGAVGGKVITTDEEDDTYDHTFTSASGKWTGNDNNRVPIRRNEDPNVNDHDTYNVLKL